MSKHRQGGDRKARLIYADPPWQFKVRDRATGLKKSADRHYGTMQLPELKQLDVAGIAATDAVMAMWTVDTHLPQAIHLAGEWGFKYVTVLFYWNKITASGKPCFGTGYYSRAGGTEQCLLFKRGKGLPVKSRSIRRTFTSPRREHSRKPDQVAGWLVDLFGDVDRAELFARTRRPGWRVAFSDEPDTFIQ